MTATHGTPHVEAHQPILEEEFEHEPIPLSHRRSLGQVAAVWFGFPMIITNAVFGGVIALVMASRAMTKENSGSAAAHGTGGNAGPAHQSGSAVAKSFSWLGGLFALL